MPRKILIALIICAPCCAGALAGEAESDTQLLSFAAFGTIGVVHSGEARADFARSLVVPTGAGYSSRWAANVDTVVGGQVTITATPKLSAMVQAVAEHRYDNSFRPHVEWANLKFEFTSDFSVRAGRIALPIFYFTESRRVGFALPWVRAPLEVYDLVPVTTNDGADFTWKKRVGPGENTLQVAIGKSDTGFSRNGASQRIVNRDQFTAADTFDIGELSLRANYGQTHLTMDVYKPLFDGFRQFAALGGDAIANRYELEGRLARYMALSASYQPGAWFAMGEWGRLETDALLGNRQGWYVSGGRRFGTLTPYLTWGEMRLLTPTSDPGLPAVANSVATPIPFLNASLNAALNLAPRQATATAGVRWDLMRNLALKLQYDHLSLGANSVGTLNNVQPGFQAGGVVHLISVAVDFVL